MTKLEAIGILAFIKESVKDDPGGRAVGEAIDIATEGLYRDAVQELSDALRDLIKQ